MRQSPVTNSSADNAALPVEAIELLHRNAGKDEFAAMRRRIEASELEPADKAMLLRGLEMATDIHDRFIQYQQRERGLNAVIETAHDLTAIRDIDPVLKAIVQRARKLMGADIGYLSIYDRERGDFYVRATAGAFSEKFKQIRVGRDIGICGYVASTRSPFSSSEYGRDSRFSHTQPIDSAVTEEGIKSILGVPLLAGNDVIGVLFVGDRYVRPYDAWDMSILSTLAAHASVAIENARLFEQAQRALEQASDANARLRKQTADTQNAADAHEKLTSLVARGGGLKDLCDMVAGMLDGHVAVIDEAEEQIHASETGPHGGDAPPLLRALPLALQDSMHAALVQSRISGRSVEAFTEPGQVCRVSAVVGNRGLLGGLIIRTSRELNEVEVRIFERSSMVTGVVLLLQARQEDAARREIPQIFRGLLSQPQRDLQRLSEQAAHHGLDLARPLCLVVLQDGDDGNRQLLGKLRRDFRAGHILFDEVDGFIVALSGTVGQAELRTTLQRLLAENARATAGGVVSRPVAPSALGEHFRSMVRCMDTLALLGRRQSIFLEQELALYAMLFDGRHATDADEFLASTLGKLYRKEKGRHAELARTLLSYLDHGHNASAAAREQGIHVNTLRQRMDAIDTLLGHWNEPGRMLEIHVSLRLWQLREGWAL